MNFFDSFSGSSVLIVVYWRPFAASVRTRAICSIAKKHHVYVTEPLPKWNKNYGLEFERILFSFGYNPYHKTNIAFTDYLSERIDKIKYFNKLSECGVKIIETKDLYCDNNKCNYFYLDNELAIYKDQNYLTDFGAIKSKNRFYSIIKDGLD